MSRVEYSVVSQREGHRVKRKVYSTHRGASRRIAMFGPEPWTVAGRNPDELFCCSGYQCICGGVTVRQYEEQRRADMPKILFVRLERREVGEWEVVEGGNP